MPSGRRSKRRPRGQAPALDLGRAGGGGRREDGPDGTWTVQVITGSEKSYRCPGCQQVIGPGVGHVVAWAADGLLGPQASLADRRHWHRSCWDARARRR